MGTDPFTRTPGIAGNAFIDMHYADEIIQNFADELSSKYVYKIVGLRGSGKSVEYGKIIDYFSKQKKWMTYTASAAGNPTKTVIAKMSREAFADSSQHSSSVNISSSLDGNIGILRGSSSFGITKSSSQRELFESEEAALYDLVTRANEKEYRILIGIDDISRTEETVKFLSIFGSLLLEGKAIYLVCTGLAKNIEDFTDEPNLTFFRRSDSIEVSSLDRFEVAAMYAKLLQIDSEKAADLARFVKGYAYAYQVLGSLYFNKKENDQLKDLLPEFDKILSQDAYDLIWKSLTESEKELVKLILNTESGRVSEIKSQMEHPNNLPMLRDRLKKKHLINTQEHGVLKIELPRFKEYVEMWES